MSLGWRDIYTLYLPAFEHSVRCSHLSVNSSNSSHQDCTFHWKVLTLSSPLLLVCTTNALNLGCRLRAGFGMLLLPLFLHFLVSTSANMDYGRNLHRTSSQSHSILKPSTSSSSSSSSGSESSSTKTKHVPVIRVVHIFNPTVIKTDAANFRSLVQELTGRSCTVDKGTRTKSRRKSTADRMVVAPQTFVDSPTTVPKRSSMYIPERLGTYSDIDIMSSLQEPVMDFGNMLPSIGGIGDESLHEVMPRFTSFYESF